MSEPDGRLLAAHDLALAALHEVTPADTVGAPAGHLVEQDGVVSLCFDTLLAGYPGWHWTVSLAAVDDAEPTVLEVELLPGDGALLAPEWVPWSVRLEEYKSAQAAAGADDDEDADDREPGDEESDDELEEEVDEEDFDADGSPLLHSGDIDGVDVDAADEDASDEDGDETGEGR
jgi:hypothetical protein